MGILNNLKKILGPKMEPALAGAPAAPGPLPVAPKRPAPIVQPFPVMTGEPNLETATVAPMAAKRGGGKVEPDPVPSLTEPIPMEPIAPVAGSPEVGDVFDLDVPPIAGFERWIVIDAWTTEQGQKVVGLRSIDGKHFATVPVEKTAIQKKPTDDPAAPVAFVPHFREGVVVEKGGAAARHKAFADHHALVVKRDHLHARGRLGDAEAIHAEIAEHEKKHGLRMGGCGSRARRRLAR